MFRNSAVSWGLALILVLAFEVAFARGLSDLTVPFVTLAKGKTSGVRVATEFVIRDRASWLALWRLHPALGPGSPPTVDFGREMVIAIFAGETPASVALAISRITREPQRLIVWYSLADRHPLPQAEDAVQITPFHIVRLARSELPVRFMRAKTPPVLRLSP